MRRDAVDHHGARTGKVCMNAPYDPAQVVIGGSVQGRLVGDVEDDLLCRDAALGDAAQGLLPQIKRAPPPHRVLVAQENTGSAWYSGVMPSA